MKKILFIIFSLIAIQATAQRSGVSWPGGYFINGPVSIYKGRDVWPDVAALLEVGTDTTNKGTIISRGFIDSLMNPNNKVGLFMYDRKDSVLYHKDGNKKVRYMTYKDTVLIKQLIAQYAPGGGGSETDSAIFITFTSLHDSLDLLRQWVLAQGFLTEEVDPEWNSEKTNYYNKTETDGLLDGKQDLIGYTPENVANKVTTVRNPNDTTYPTTKAVTDTLQDYAKLVDIPATPTLQEVTDAGNATTNKITVLDVDFDTIPGYSAARAAARLYAGSDSVKVGFCIVKFAVDGGGNITPSLLADTDHRGIRFTTMSYSSGPILTINFAPTATKILYCSITPDETWANAGITAGARANLGNLQVEMSWPKGNWAGLMFRDSTNTWRFSPNIASSQVIEYAPNGFEWVETSSSQMGGKLSPMSDYQGAVSAGYHYTYAGTNGYRLVKAQNYPYYLQKRMQLVDAYGNPVPLTSLTHLDMIQVNSNRSLQMNPQWNYNIWSLFNSSCNLWVTVVYENIGLWLLLLGVPFRVKRTKRGFKIELIKMFRA